MSTIFDSFERKHDFLICVDSDGCAMDTMDIKHFRCFGPCMIEVWGLHAHEQELLARWNEVNLYTMTRGINRFKGLAIALKEAEETYDDVQIDDLETFLRWTETTKELSNRAIEEVLAQKESKSLRMALEWSERVNVAIKNLPEEENLPFEGAKAGLAAAHAAADVAIVSSANAGAVREDITPIEKQDLEYRFWELSNGGKIQYVKYPINYNKEAIKALVRRAMDMGLYEGVNLSLAYCDDCGHEELAMDVCPVCGSKNLTKIDRMNGYLSYSRVKGDTRLNDAKMAEIAERKSM